MPLLDHFHAPLDQDFPWDGFHATWATRLADRLNDHWLPPEFIAIEQTRAGSPVEIDVATLQRIAGRQPEPGNGPATATLPPQVWAPPDPARTFAAVFPENVAIRVFNTTAGLTLVGAIELVSPSNKDRPEERRAFATKCASYLYQGISLIVMDVVTSRRANLHNEMIGLMAVGDTFRLPAEQDLYAVAYRPVLRQERAEIDFWPAAVAVGSPLPTLPLRLNRDLFVPVEFDAAYQEACRRRRLA
jgi:hypothetical protein